MSESRGGGRGGGKPKDEKKKGAKAWKKAAHIVEIDKTISHIAEEVEKKSVIYMKYAPFPHIPDDDSIEISTRNAIEMHWCRFFYVALFCMVYFKAIVKSEQHRELLAAETQDILGEFFPDQTVSAERFTKGEIAPAFAELLNGDDVSKLLNWFQAFCMYKTGSDEHIPFGWNCGIAGIEMDKMHPVKWDMITNSPPIKSSSNESYELLKEFCSSQFVRSHIIAGDDPRIVPWGDVEAFRKFVRAIDARDGIVHSDGYMFDGTYDEWAILNGNPWLNILMRAAEMGYNHTRDFEKDPEERWTIKGPNSQTSYLVPKGMSGPYQEPIEQITPSSLTEMYQYFADKEKDSAPMKQYKEMMKARVAAQQKRQNHRKSETGLESTESSKDDAFLAATKQMKTLAKQSVRDSLRTILNEKLQNLSTNETNSGASSFLHVEAPVGSASVGSGSGEDSASVGSGSGDEDLGAQDDPDRNPVPRPINDAMKTVEEEEANPAEDYGETHGGLAGATPQGLMPFWCFLPYSKMLSLFARLEQLKLIHYDRDYMTKPEAAKLFWYYGIKDEQTFEDQFKVLDIDKNNKLAWSELYSSVGSGGKGLKIDPDKFRGLSSICLNHHFGMLHMCGPEVIEVTWRVEKQVWDEKESSKKKVWDLHRHSVITLVTRFEQTGMDIEDPKDGPTGWYTSSLKVEAYDFVGKKGWLHIILGLLTVILFVSIFAIDGVLTLITFPLSLVQLICANKDSVTDLRQVQKLLMHTLDFRGTRARYMGAPHIFLENLFCFCFILAVVFSTIDQYRASIPLRGSLYSTQCMESVENKVQEQLENGNSVSLIALSPMEYYANCMHATEAEGNWLAEALTGALFVDNYLHGLALLILAFRLLDAFNAIDSTQWLGNTVILCGRKLLYFMFFWFFVVCSFSGLMHVCFGSHFMQFRSFGRSFIAMALFSFGFGDRVVQGVHTFEDYTSFSVTMELFIFSVVVVSIGMNFFTTIILDSYSSLKGDGYEEKLNEEANYVLKSVAFALFPRVNVDQPVRSFGGYQVSRIMH